ncbi:aminotransferase class V-fold PLP-dependent enzyme [Paenibacillus sp. 598K]|uniref:cysteine desulfurase family protein n=1 Tax=Paenibacillus sp. 598K TaxID=1117987 RepID=UPI000FFA8294|nr:cysteine desulfurase family protein [Paenibacillus sp. 598K]GBF75445.1 aminotransferase class V-fold PLP-dependent enzyme [Paenibacillus sp. 598K]
MLYFDHCASTPPHEDVVRTMSEIMTRHYANPSSLHRAGIEAERLIARAREVLAGVFGVSPAEWVFTSSGTESNNLAIFGAARAMQHRGRHLITSPTEHASVYEAFRQLEREGYEVSWLPVDRQGRIDPQALAQSIREDTTLVSLMHVNNETGAVQPLSELAAVLAEHPRVLFHVDAVQSVGKLPIMLRPWRIDLLTLSPHKLRGPKGTGVLYVREGVRLQPLLFGGSHEAGRRAGTANTAGIVTSVKAVRLAVESQAERAHRMGRLGERLRGRLAGAQGIVLTKVDGAPHIVHLCCPSLKPEVIVHLLEQDGFLVSTQSACSSKSGQPSRVLLAMRLERQLAESGIRISFGDEHTESDIDRLADALERAVARLQQLEEGRVE